MGRIHGCLTIYIISKYFPHSQKMYWIFLRHYLRPMAWRRHNTHTCTLHVYLQTKSSLLADNVFHPYGMHTTWIYDRLFLRCRCRGLAMGHIPMQGVHRTLKGFVVRMSILYWSKSHDLIQPAEEEMNKAACAVFCLVPVAAHIVKFLHFCLTVGYTVASKYCRHTAISRLPGKQVEGAKTFQL